ncbi:MAG: hypothetical protein Kow0031_15280 [Anaerolineae bacterium]
MSSAPLFIRQFKDDFFHMGAILPSSRYLGQAGARYLARRDPTRPVRVLEAGAGTGSFTREIVPLLRPGDTLDAVELNGSLVAHLRRRLAVEPAFKAAPGVEINLINADVRSMAAGEYDYIVFSLPLTNFPPPLVEEILSLMVERLKPGGVFSYVKYIFISRFKYAFGGAETRAQMDANAAIIARFAERYQFDQQAVTRNVPPTWVYYWQQPTGG